MISKTALAGRVAFVAGGSSGINLGIAQRLAETGASVVLVSGSAEKIAAAASITDAGTMRSACCRRAQFRRDRRHVRPGDRALRANLFISRCLDTDRNLLTRSENVGWLGRQDSNLRMAAPKAAALPLGDAPTFPADMSRRERALITARAILQSPEKALMRSDRASRKDRAPRRSGSRPKIRAATW
jgi:NAD(P)-dependent dehydrogenase (short-subunit alcohol dehydrogenase family)